jgi:hypothetical protein
LAGEHRSFELVQNFRRNTLGRQAPKNGFTCFSCRDLSESTRLPSASFQLR